METTDHSQENGTASKLSKYAYYPQYLAMEKPQEELTDNMHNELDTHSKTENNAMPTVYIALSVTLEDRNRGEK